MSQTLDARFDGRLGNFVLHAALSVPGHGVTGIFGPSGCGKTTLLRAIAGLAHFPGGYCALNGDVWQEGAAFVPTHRRPIGYVFQEPSLFPHLSIRKNLAFGMRGQKPGFFNDVVDVLRLEPLMGRAPAALSGGERQRVAVGRALLSNPRLLLMDEPLSALDAASKAEILPLLERLMQTLSIPCLYVSHDMAELDRFAEYLLVMNAGTVVANGPLHEIQTNPALPLARARTAGVTLSAKVSQADAGDGLMLLDVAGARFLLARSGAVEGDILRLRVAAGDVSIALEPPRQSSILNTLPAVIVSTTPVSEADMLVVLALGPEGAGPQILARVTRRSWATLQLAPGCPVHAQVKSIALARQQSHLV